jgi:hypothetical protein
MEGTFSLPFINLSIISSSSSSSSSSHLDSICPHMTEKKEQRAKAADAEEQRVTPPGHGAEAGPAGASTQGTKTGADSLSMPVSDHSSIVSSYHYHKQ